MQTTSQPAKREQKKSRLRGSGTPALILVAAGLVLGGMAFLNLGKDKTPDQVAQAKPPAANIAFISPAASDLRSTLNVVLAEHVSLACNATGAALGGRDPEFKAAAGALDANSVALARIVGSAYGPDAEAAFLAGWRRHIGMFVDYTTGSATNDAAKNAKAVADLHQYAIEVAELFNKANGLPNEAVIKIVDDHVRTLTAVIDAQAAKDPVKTFSALRVSVGFMQTLADPLSEATVKKFPDKFGPQP